MTTRSTVKAHSLVLPRPIPKQHRRQQLRKSLAKTNPVKRRQPRTILATLIIETDTGVITLPDEDPEVFATYVQLLYTGTLPSFEPFEKDIRGTSADGIDQTENDFKTAMLRNIHKQCNMLGQLYVVAEKLRDVDTKSSVMSAMVENLHRRGVLMVAAIFQNAVPLRSSTQERSLLIQCESSLGM
jgi:hypothetical protein